MVTHLFIYESDYTQNGDYKALEPNQYRVIVRAGIHNVVYQNMIIKFWDYHFWYQTYNGQWADKHGSSENSEPELLSIGIIPSSTNSTGWALGMYEDFYDSPFYSYIITLNN